MMRFTPFLVLLFCSLMPLSLAAPLPIPVITMNLEAPMQIVNYSANETAVPFNGSVKVDKLPMERMLVVLACSVDRGWSSNCSPSEIVITDTSEHDFTCTVMVPGKPDHDVANLSVEAAGAFGFTETARANGTIAVTGRPPPPPANATNQTSTNATGGDQNGTGHSGNGSTAGDGMKNIVAQLQKNAIPVSAAVVIMIGVAAVAVTVRSRRRRKVIVVEVLEEGPRT